LFKHISVLHSLSPAVNDKNSLIDGLQQRIVDLETSFEGKVDKQIMKSLVLCYFSTQTDKRQEVERLLARILDFNQLEMEKAHILIGRDRKRTPSGNWIPFFGGSTSTTTRDSLSQQFVQFLENESKPNQNHNSSKEIARDLSRSLLSAATSGATASAMSASSAVTTGFLARHNPFLASASTGGSRSSSANSSTDNLNNQLLIGPSMTSSFPLLVSTNSDQSHHSIDSREKSDVLHNNGFTNKTV